eukprot:1824258-Pyramimonas_sp.AAC.1
MARPLARRLARPLRHSASRPPGISSIRSISVRKGLGCKGGLDPRGYSTIAPWYIALAPAVNRQPGF